MVLASVPPPHPATQGSRFSKLCTLLTHDVPTHVPLSMSLTYIPTSAEGAYVIYNANSTNKWGNPRGYHIHPGPAVHLTNLKSKRTEKNVNWAKHHLAVSRLKEDEPSSSSMWNINLPGAPPVDFYKVCFYFPTSDGFELMGFYSFSIMRRLSRKILLYGLIWERTISLELKVRFYSTHVLLSHTMMYHTPRLTKHTHEPRNIIYPPRTMELQRLRRFDRITQLGSSE
jgi:hypothetical protein